MRRVRLWAFIAIIAGSGALRADTPAKNAPMDSGRYSFEIDCSQTTPGLDCRTTVRDLVYDTVLGQPRLGVLPGGSLGSGFEFEGNPARGEKQRVAVFLEPDAEAGTAAFPKRVRIRVEVSEGVHVVQQYRFAVPVGGK